MMGLFVLYPLLVVLGILFFILSVASRRSYVCSTCGEKFVEMEHMRAEHCNMCGASLKTISENQALEDQVSKNNDSEKPPEFIV